MATFNFGERQLVESWSRGIQLSADGYPKAKPGGAEFKWSSVTALAKDTYLTDQLDSASDPQGVDALSPYSAETAGNDPTSFANSKALSGERPVPAGFKVLRFGTPIMRDTDGKFIVATGDVSALRGDVFLVNETVIYDPDTSATTQVDPKSLYPIAIDGGRVFKDRILRSDSGSDTNHDIVGIDVDGAEVVQASLPTLAQTLAALPNISLARD
jgi:hypothetical protein